MLPVATAAISEMMFSKQVGSHHYVEGLGPAHQVHGHPVHQQRLGLNLGIFGRNRFENLIPEDHAESLRV